MDFAHARLERDHVANGHVPRHALVIDIKAQVFGDGGRLFSNLLREVGERFYWPAYWSDRTDRASSIDPK